MNDLISREQLINKLNSTGTNITLDIPVEEILGENVDLDDFAALVQDAIQAYRKMVIDTIKNIPIAFNLDKKVERLERELMLADQDKERCARENQMQFDFAKGYSMGVTNALEIVKEKDSKAIKARCKLRTGKGRPEWGAEPDKQYYILEILDKEKLAADM